LRALREHAVVRLEFGVAGGKFKSGRCRLESGPVIAHRTRLVPVSALRELSAPFELQCWYA
jgi:hypothetical protein